MPIRNSTLILAPFANGVPRVIVPALKVLLKPPPFGCDGGCSRVSPCTFTVHGVVATPFDARQVAASLMPATTTNVEVRGRRSETPLGAGKVVKSTMRKRSRVTEPPVLLTNLRRKLIVPKVEFCAGTEVKSRTRLGGFEPAAVLSSAKFANEELR